MPTRKAKKTTKSKAVKGKAGKAKAKAAPGKGDTSVQQGAVDPELRCRAGDGRPRLYTPSSSTATRPAPRASAPTS